MSASIRPRVRNDAAAIPATAFSILGMISLAHFINDMTQALMPAIYPVLKAFYHFSFFQIGVLAFGWNLTASLLQPWVGMVTDRRPMPFLLVAGMAISMAGLLAVAEARMFVLLLLANMLVGVGSSIFHPESSRIARLASGGRHGLAQSLFQVGGNFGTSLGPLLAAFLVVPRGQHAVAWFAVATLLGMGVQFQVARWYRAQIARPAPAIRTVAPPRFSSAQVRLGVWVLLALIFSKFFYMASLTSYYTFYLIHRFGLSIRAADLHLFLFLASVALGTVAGGPIGDRIGRKPVIWISILGVLPLSLLLPHLDLFWTTVLSVPIGLLIASAFPAIVVFAQELLPGKPGMVSGLFFGFAFGVAGVGAALMGWLADRTSIETVYALAAFLPALGLLAALLPRRA